MKQSYLDVLKRIEKVSGSHPQVNSVATGRELELDIAKSDLFPRVFIRTEPTELIGGPGSLEVTNLFSILVVDRLKVDRSNVNTVLNDTQAILLAIMATLQKERLIRWEDNPSLTPLYDYQDTQTAGWLTGVTVYMDMVVECYPVP